jgi:hypothetical protein
MLRSASASELFDRTEAIKADPRKAALKMARLQRQAEKAYGERDELLIYLSTLYDSHLMPITQRQKGQDWDWALCVHAPQGLLIWKLDNATAARFDHLERITADHYTEKHRIEERSKRLTNREGLTG